MSQANSLTASDQAPIGKKDERRVSPSLAAGDEDSDNDDDEGSITCPCGIEKEDLDMVCCSRCKNWAHCACYGFTSATDKSIPKILLCFTCQNEDAKGTMGQGQGKPLYNMDRISEIALFRRGLHIAWDSGVPSATRFSKLLGVNVAQTRQIITRLQTEGFLVENKSKAKAKRGRPSASADDDQTTHQYLVVKNKKSIAHFQKWNGDFGLAAAVVNPYTSLAMETQRQFSANAKATPARSDVLPEIVGTRETDSTARDVLPTPPQTTKKASMRQTTPVPSTPKRVTRALSRSLSVSLFSDDEDNAKLGMSSPPPTHKESKIFTIPDTPHRMTRSMSRAMSASLSDEENGGHGKTLMPATPSKSRLRSATPDCVNLIDSPRKTLKKEFLEKVR
ncbi:hypothetical protein DFS34DRAFT_412829 [Phlyctochytrium arcticum]|nr:hypothetical protein DFS34DRAFT_412829 [Phlyctochytrium arcticum]